MSNRIEAGTIGTAGKHEPTAPTIQEKLYHTENGPNTNPDTDQESSPESNRESSVTFLFRSILMERAEKVLSDLFPGEGQEEFRMTVPVLFLDWQGEAGLVELLNTPREVLRECLPLAVAGIRTGLISVDRMNEWRYSPQEKPEVDVDALLATVPADFRIHIADTSGVEKSTPVSNDTPVELFKTEKLTGKDGNTHPAITPVPGGIG